MKAWAITVLLATSATACAGNVATEDEALALAGAEATSDVGVDTDDRSAAQGGNACRANEAWRIMPGISGAGTGTASLAFSTVTLSHGAPTRSEAANRFTMTVRATRQVLVGPYFEFPNPLPQFSYETETVADGTLTINGDGSGRFTGTLALPIPFVGSPAAPVDFLTGPGTVFEVTPECGVRWSSYVRDGDGSWWPTWSGAVNENGQFVGSLATLIATNVSGSL